jgi:2-keto-3-deoxy-L-rhamnonate aldolase RhmA
MERTVNLAAWQQLPNPQVTEAMASLGFDWLVIDVEHSSITFQEAEHCFIAADNQGCKPMVRLDKACPYSARRYLDAGAKGLIVPVVENRESFDAFAKHCYFPPKGKRGLGLVRANKWGATLKEYVDDFQPILIAQIETRMGAMNCNDILDSPFIDGIMIGPYDLSADLNCPGKFDNEEFIQICATICKSAKNKKKLLGYHQVATDEEQLKKRINEGYNFIAYGTDIIAMRSALQGIGKVIKL